MILVKLKLYATEQNKQATIFMYKILLNLIFLSISFACIFSGCKSGKQASSFKHSQQPIDTLVLFTPHIFIESVTKTTNSPDDELAAKLSHKISGITTSTLKGKYQMVNEPFLLEQKYDKDITTFFNNLDSLKSEMNDIELPQWLKNNMNKSSNRYFIATFVYGYYNSGYEPNYVMKQAMQTNTLMLGRSGLNWVSIKILLADRETNKVLFYNLDNSYQSDPRISSSVEAMIKKLIRPIYYR